MKNSFQILVLAAVSTLVLFSCSNGRTDLKNQACKHEGEFNTVYDNLLNQVQSSLRQGTENNVAVKMPITDEEVSLLLTDNGDLNLDATTKFIVTKTNVGEDVARCSAEVLNEFVNTITKTPIANKKQVMSTIVEKKKQQYSLVATERSKIDLSAAAVAISLDPKPIGLIILDDGKTPLELALSDCARARDRDLKALNMNTGIEAVCGALFVIITMGPAAPAGMRPLHGSKSDYRLLSIW